MFYYLESLAMKGRVLRGVVLAVVAVMLSVVAMAQSAHSHNHSHTIHAEDKGPRLGTEWGVGIGAAYSMLDADSDPATLNPRLGYQGHLHMGLLFGRNFALEVELCYSGSSIRAEQLSLDRKIRLTTIDIPVLLSFRVLNSRLQLDLGPVFTVRSSAEYTLDSETKFFGPVYPTWNLAAGVGVRLFRNLMLDVRYIYPLTTTTNQFEGNEFTMRTSRVTGGLTLMF